MSKNAKTSDVSDTIKTAVTQIVTGKYGKYNFTDEIKEAIKQGYAIDADPYWTFSDDPRIGVCAALTDKGKKIAEELGLIKKCKCPDCKLNAHANTEKYQGYCPNCFSSGKVYGFEKDGKCAFHHRMIALNLKDMKFPHFGGNRRVYD